MVGRLTLPVTAKTPNTESTTTNAANARKPTGGAGRTRQPYASRDGENKKVQKTVRMPEVLYEEIEAKALALGKSFQQYLVEFLTTAWCFEFPESQTPPAEGGSPRLIGLVPLAELLGVTARTTQNWSHEKGADPFPNPEAKEGKSFLYNRDAVLAWAERNRGLTPKGQLVRVEDARRAQTPITPTERTALAVRDAFGPLTEAELVERTTNEVMARLAARAVAVTPGATSAPSAP